MSQMLTASDAGKILGMSASGVRKLDDRGVLKAARTESGMRIFDRSDVVKLRERRKASVETSPA